MSNLQLPPPISIQAAEQGFEAGLFKANAGPSTYLFNNAFFLREGKLWMAARQTHLVGGRWSECMSDLMAFPVNSDMTVGPAESIYYPRRSPMENIEDPRVIPYGDGYLVSLCSWERSNRPENVQCQQVCCFMDQSLRIRSVWTPEYGKNSGRFGGNTGFEKNWIWWLDGEGQLCFTYMTQPHHVAITDGRKVVGNSTTDYDHRWLFGHIRGGTPPVQIGDEYVVAFHSSLPWKSVRGLGLRMKYFLSFLSFEPTYPYKVKRICRRPILSGTDQDPVIRESPAVVFPCGLVKVGDDLLVSLGSNDIAMGWARIPIRLVDGWMEPV